MSYDLQLTFRWNHFCLTLTRIGAFAASANLSHINMSLLFLVVVVLSGEFSKGEFPGGREVF